MAEWLDRKTFKAKMETDPLRPVKEIKAWSRKDNGWAVFDTMHYCSALAAFVFMSLTDIAVPFLQWTVVWGD